ncbi:MAG: hypothetical protein ABW005_12080 [Burkholderiaceae bacterium]
MNALRLASRLARPGAGLLLALAATIAVAAGPARNLLVELRWVDASLSGAALAGVREGATVVGTAGSVSPRPGGVTVSTGDLDAEPVPVQRLLVLNGQSASVMLSEQQPLQWLDYSVELPAVAAGGGNAGKGGNGGNGGSNGNAAPGARVYAAPRSTLVERQRGFVVSPHWPGGRQPVRVELRAITPGEQGQAQIFTTVQLGLDEWLAVARSGAPPPRPQPGMLSTRDAEARPSRELQLRVGLAP